LPDDETLKLLQEQLRALTEHVQRLTERQPEPPPTPTEDTNAELWDIWWPTVEHTGRAKNIRTHRRYVIETEFSHRGQTLTLGTLRPSECTIDVIEAWRSGLRKLRNIRGKPLAPDYRDQIRMSAQSMWRYHVDIGRIARNPLKGVPREDGWKGRMRLGFPTREWMAEFAPHCHRIVADMIWLSFEAGGLRKTELRLLRKDEYDKTAGLLCLNEERNKNGDPRTVVLNTHAREIVERNIENSRSEWVFDHPLRRQGGAIPQSTLDKLVRKGREAAAAFGVVTNLSGDPFSLHLCRHAYTMWTLDEGIALNRVSEQLGHRDTTQAAKRYGRLRGPKATESLRWKLDRPKGCSCREDAQDPECVIHGQRRDPQKIFKENPQARKKA